MATWQTHFTERELKEIDFCKVYQRDFLHGTDGHNIRLIVAKLVNILEEGVVPNGESLLTKAVVMPRPDSSKPIIPNKPASFA